jgi:hypothetical protein
VEALELEESLDELDEESEGEPPVMEPDLPLSVL